MNILLDDELEPHISDFGIAKLLDQSSPALMSGILRGTIGYIAPGKFNFFFFFFNFRVFCSYINYMVMMMMKMF